MGAGCFWQAASRHLDALAAAKARDAVLVSVIASVARAYIELRGFQAQLAVTRRNIETARRSLQVVQTRFSEGLINELDVTLAQRQLATFEAGLAPLTSQFQASQYAIAGLLGQYPETLAEEMSTDGPAPRFPPKNSCGHAGQSVTAPCGHPATGIRDRSRDSAHGVCNRRTFSARFPGHGQMKPEQQEIARLKREVARLKAERDVLKKAAAYFAKE